MMSCMSKPNQLRSPSGSFAANTSPVCRESFSQVLVDCIGALPKTKFGNQLLCTSLYTFLERFLYEISKHQTCWVTHQIFTFVGLPGFLQQNQESKFMLKFMEQVLYQLRIKQYKSSAYHSESQGAIEHFHRPIEQSKSVHLSHLTAFLSISSCHSAQKMTLRPFSGWLTRLLQG